MIVLIGAGGMLGRAFAGRLEQDGRAFRAAPRHPELDIRDEHQVAALITDGVSIVLNCAAYTDVDGAEASEAAANAVNGDAVARLVTRCDAVGAKLVHFSTDYVFDGRLRSEPYRTDEPLSPVNAYGRSKALGESHVLASKGDHLLIRTSWLYAPWSKNFVCTIAKLATQLDTLKVVDDQRGRPTSAEQLARVTLALLDDGASGVFHVTDGGDECTWFDLASLIAETVAPSCVVTPCSSDEYPRPAPRPAYSVLDIRETEARVGPLTPWRDSVRDVLGRIG